MKFFEDVASTKNFDILPLATSSIFTSPQNFLVIKYSVICFKCSKHANCVIYKGYWNLKQFPHFRLEISSTISLSIFKYVLIICLVTYWTAKLSHTYLLSSLSQTNLYIHIRQVLICPQFKEYIQLTEIWMRNKFCSPIYVQEFLLLNESWRNCV